MSKQEIEGEMSIVFKIDGVTWTPEQVESLLETIWPGKPQWEPTPEQPQQSFYEAVVQSKDQRIADLERKLTAYEKGTRPQIAKILDKAKAPTVVDGMSLRLDERFEYAWEDLERKLTVAREALKNYPTLDANKMADLAVSDWQNNERNLLETFKSHLRAFSLKAEQYRKQALAALDGEVR